MFSKSILIILLLLISVSVVYAAEDNNSGNILAIAKVNNTACTIKIEGATFPNTCTTAVYQQAYFDCTTSKGKAYLSLGLAAYISRIPVRIVSTDCSNYGSSVANLTELWLEQ